MYICKICNKKFNSLKGLSNHIRSCHKMTSQDYYDNFLLKDGENLCKTCNNKTKFLGLIRGYSKYCSNKCISRKHKTGYSGRCLICGKEFDSLEIHLKSTHNISSKDYYDKFLLKNKENICENCGGVTKFISLKEGYSRTCSRTCTFELNKKNKTYITKECLYCGKKFDSLKSSNRLYCSKECFNKSKLVLIKRQRTNLKKYNSNYGFQSEIIKDKIKETRNKKFYESLFSSDRLSDLVLPKFNIESYSGTKEELYKFECKKCGNIFEDTLRDGKVPMCPICYPKNYIHSKAEEEIYNYLKTLINKSEIIRNDKVILNGLELDFLIPKYKIAIEFDGLY
jgi:predicted transcriptional regulator